MKEEWRDVVGYKGLYKISNTGKLISLDRYTPYIRGGIKWSYSDHCLTPSEYRNKGRTK